MVLFLPRSTIHLPVEVKPGPTGFGSGFGPGWVLKTDTQSGSGIESPKPGPTRPNAIPNIHLR